MTAMDKDNWFAGRTLHYEAIGVLMCPWHIVCGIDPDLCYVCYVRGCYLVPSIGGAPTQGGARRTQHETDASIYKWKPTHSDAIRVRRPTFAKTDLTQKRRKYLETKLSRSQTCLEIDLPRNPHLPKPIYIYICSHLVAFSAWFPPADGPEKSSGTLPSQTVSVQFQTVQTCMEWGETTVFCTREKTEKRHAQVWRRNFHRNSHLQAAPYTSALIVAGRLAVRREYVKARKVSRRPISLVVQV